MNSTTSKHHNLVRRKHRVRSKINGTSTRPRLSVYISNKHVVGQLIDDASGTTLVYASSIRQSSLPDNLTKKAEWVGKEIAKKAKAKKISSVVFDRNGRLYHGRVKALADSARENGLEF